MSEVYEIKNFMSRNSWITIKRSTVKEKVRKSVPVKWVLNYKEETYG